MREKQEDSVDEAAWKSFAHIKTRNHSNVDIELDQERNIKIKCIVSSSECLLRWMLSLHSIEISLGSPIQGKSIFEINFFSFSLTFYSYFPLRMITMMIK